MMSNFIHYCNIGLDLTGGKDKLVECEVGFQVILHRRLVKELNFMNRHMCIPNLLQLVNGLVSCQQNQAEGTLVEHMRSR